MRTNHFLTTTIEGTLIGAVRQTKDGKFNGTYLLQRCNELFGTRKEIGNYLKLQSTREYFATIWWYEVGVLETHFSTFLNLKDCKESSLKND